MYNPLKIIYNDLKNHCAVLFDPLKLLKAPQALLDRLKISEHPAKPPLVDIEHPTFRGLIFGYILRLFLRSDEQDVLPGLGYAL